MGPRGYIFQTWRRTNRRIQLLVKVVDTHLKQVFAVGPKERADSFAGVLESKVFRPRVRPKHRRVPAFVRLELKLVDYESAASPMDRRNELS